MKTLTILFAVICCLFTTSCTTTAPEINDFRVQAGMSSSIVSLTTQTAAAPTIKVSFVGSCVTIVSADELLNMVMATTEGEVTLTNLGKRSGMFCSPNNADVSTVWISTVDKKVSRHDNKNIKSKSIAQK